ncbi:MULTISPECIES: ArsR family transcriptional regulator [Oceanobacillus]|nr:MULTISPECIES: ArsR family transcriptional regulator [Oceanobacillus]
MILQKKYSVNEITDTLSITQPIVLHQLRF